MVQTLVHENGCSHEDTAYANVRTEPFSYSRAFPENAHDTVLIPIHDAGCEMVDVCARANEEEQNEEERSEIEECGHFLFLSFFLLFLWQ